MENKIYGFDDLPKIPGKDLKIFKFVKVDGKYYFGEVTGVSMNFSLKCAALLPKEYDKIESAGSITVFKTEWHLSSDYSIGLKVGCSKEHVAEISRGLRKLCTRRY